MGPSDSNNWEAMLPNFPSYEKYKELNNGSNLTDEKGDCTKIPTSKDGIKGFCKKVLKNLRAISDLKGDENRKSSCYYFQHWFFEELGKNFTITNAMDTDVVIASFFDLITEISLNDLKEDACKCYPSGNVSVWKKEKDLHDYFENFDRINCEKSSIDECQKYIELVTYISPIYIEKEYNCCYDGDIEYDYCKAYIRCEEKYNPSELLTKLKAQLQVLEKQDIPVVPVEITVTQQSAGSSHSIGGTHVDMSESARHSSEGTKEYQSMTFKIGEEAVNTLHNTEPTPSEVNTNSFNFILTIYNMMNSNSFYRFIIVSTVLLRETKSMKKKFANNYYNDINDDLSDYDSEHILLDSGRRLHYFIPHTI
ncbi:variable surface protein [Plasmodium gonderi]|uniref:Variable surface protein n=1 Tax=Plasmodium gonderi TaxID=77519 RepID=A0A1Y1JCF0_PLAGO|nr:variable surface protein [Plasmodium gonderi]GAW79035.1 variable surface protein [Plasmodium gonderi]